MTLRSTRATRGGAHKLITVGTQVLLVIAMVGLVGAGMEMVFDEHAGHSQGIGNAP